MRIRLLCVLVLFSALNAYSQTRQTELFNSDWLFHLGPQAPAGEDDSLWQEVALPHDWAVDLPFSGDAPGGAGYKCIGSRYPQNSTGWYRKRFRLESWEKGRHVEIRFDGIARSSEVYCNGVYIGHSRAGLVPAVYDLSQYLNYGAENEITVRVDASVSGEDCVYGAGICRDVYLVKTSSVFIPAYSTRVSANFGVVEVHTRVSNLNLLWDTRTTLSLVMKIYDAEGAVAASSGPYVFQSLPFETTELTGELHLRIPHLWDLDDRYMYTLRTELYRGDDLLDDETVRFGVRDIVFDPSRGIVLKNLGVALNGVNLRSDHAGVGIAVPRELWRYRLERLREIGVSAIRLVDSPASPALLELCDETGMLVIDEISCQGTNAEQLGTLREIMERDGNHPSVILWSLGGEDAAAEGFDLAGPMTKYAHTVDPSRCVVYSGNGISRGAADLTGFRDLRGSSPVGEHSLHPKWRLIGLGEPSGSGTRGVYVSDPSRGWLRPPARNDDRIGSALDFYSGKSWLAGLFFDSGFDYRGSDASCGWPSTLSQTGLFDYCGYPKDEAFYLQSLWTWTPVLHITPESDGEIRVYTNCEYVDLTVDGRKSGRRYSSGNGWLVWNTDRRGSGKIVAKGSYQGRPYVPRVNISATFPEPLKATTLTASKTVLWADGQDVVVVDIVSDKPVLEVSLQGPADILGWGNGDPGFREPERPRPGEAADRAVVKPFGRRAQVIIRGRKGERGRLFLQADGKSVSIDCF